MSHARLLSIEVKRFKSYRNTARLDLKPLTVLVGRNNSGKSTMVQALLLLKQTLESPRADVSLNLAGAVEALSLRELTSGWPEPRAVGAEGPSFSLVLESRIDVEQAVSATRRTSTKALSQHGLTVLKQPDPPAHATVQTAITLGFREEGRRAALKHVYITSRKSAEASAPEVYSEDFIVRLLRTPDGEVTGSIGGQRAPDFGIEWDHFLPIITLNRTTLGPRNQRRIAHDLWLFRCLQPLEDLRGVLRRFGLLGSTRALPPALYRRGVSAPPEAVGASGEHAAELLHARRGDVVHYLPPIAVHQNVPVVAEAVRARPLVDAVNDVFSSMGVDERVSIDDVSDAGFRLLFGKATLQHAGRGITYLLPIVEYGLLLDPQQFGPSVTDLDREAFVGALTRYSLAAMEAPEAHLHPKLQAHLAHWFVALAMCGRNLIVETHSDHLVRRLRGLIARAPQGGPVEKWLRENVAIVEAFKDAAGDSTLESSALTPGGDFERRPVDFMDAATDEERKIYDAALAKAASEVRDLDEPSGGVRAEGDAPGPKGP